VAAFKARHGIDRPYFLIVGSRDGHKNAELFFRAFARFGEARASYGIVCTNANQPLDAACAGNAGEAQVHLLVLDDPDLQCAYTGAVALVYPSRYEGFGLPVLEAMICSCPVVTCSNSSIPEVAGEAAIFVDPDDPAMLHEALLAVQEEPLRSALVDKGQAQARGFSWRKMADDVEEALTTWAGR